MQFQHCRFTDREKGWSMWHFYHWNSQNLSPNRIFLLHKIGGTLFGPWFLILIQTSTTGFWCLSIVMLMSFTDRKVYCPRFLMRTCSWAIFFCFRQVLILFFCASSARMFFWVPRYPDLPTSEIPKLPFETKSCILSLPTVFNPQQAYRGSFESDLGLKIIQLSANEPNNKIAIQFVCHRTKAHYYFRCELWQNLKNIANFKYHEIKWGTTK